MAGWSFFTRCSALDFADVVNRHQGGGNCCQDIGKICCLVDDPDNNDWLSLRGVFDQVLSAFLNEETGRGCHKPLPALLGNGQFLDLFELLWLVKRRGGFELVNGFWTFVAKELGLDLGTSASIKLIYFKYLFKLESCSKWRCSANILTNGECQNCSNFGLASLELETRFEHLLSHKYDKKKVKSDTHSSTELVKNGKCADMNGSRSGGPLVDYESVNFVKNHSDDDEKCNGYNKGKCSDDDNDLIIGPITSRKDTTSRKRKRESLSRMLNWVIQIAKSPNDPSVGGIPPPPNWKKHIGTEMWIQVIRARDAVMACCMSFNGVPVISKIYLKRQ
ncbi:hypothetical protein K2173_010360 [Erythroxylum novogranatense]|uniref:ARID domain-containing protein n=1 Tax=Erythroxylum novogranatense TaxID=1862640 RepID=A0AAV8TFT5_9ROSI|nr:hypothetical protein K2173_010360 [Erythroxylum novogranatense]